jgi:hypothetical protein
MGYTNTEIQSKTPNKQVINNIYKKNIIMNNILSEGEVREINRIREIMMIKESKMDDSKILYEGRIGSQLSQELWTKIKNGFSGIRNSRDFSSFTDAQWDRALTALERDEIDNLPQSYQLMISKLIKLKFSDFITKIYQKILELYFKKYPGESYTDFISLLSTASKSTGKSISEILKTEGKDGKAILRNENGFTDYFAIDLISPRLETDVSNFQNKKPFEFEVASQPKPPKSERLANWLDTKVGKYKTARAFYEGMLRGEPGSKYFFQLVAQNSKNIVRKLQKKELLNGLTSEQKKIAVNWFVTGVADWRMVERYRRQLGWPYRLPNVAGQIFRKWIILSAMLSIYSVGKSLVNAAPETAEKMEIPEALWERVVKELVAANPGITSPLFRIFDIIIFTVLVPALKGRSEYKEAWNEYFDGQLSRINTLFNRTARGENVEDEELNTVLNNPETPDTTVQGVPMPNQQRRGDTLSFDSTNNRIARDSTASPTW